MRKVKEDRASALRRHYEPIKEGAAACLKPGYTPLQYLDGLVSNSFFEDAVTFLAHALPPRESIWWSCVSLREAEGADTTTIKDIAALRAAEQWVYVPDEATRRICGRLAEKSNYKTAASWAAAAVFWSGGSILAPGEAKVEPAPYLYAKAVTGAILTAIGESNCDDMNDVYVRLIKIGVNIGNGKNR